MYELCWSERVASTDANGMTIVVDESQMAPSERRHLHSRRLELSERMRARFEERENQLINRLQLHLRLQSPVYLGISALIYSSVSRYFLSPFSPFMYPLYFTIQLECLLFHPRGG